MEILNKDFFKTKDAILSCQTTDQLRSAKNMIEIYRIKNPSLKHQYDLLLEFYILKKNEFNPVKFNQEITSI